MDVYTALILPSILERAHKLNRAHKALAMPGVE